MLKNIFYLVLFSFLVPFLVNNKPLLTFQQFTLYPVIPYGENQFFDGVAPLAPSLAHPLGTDDRGRDLLVRILYGFKNNFLFCLSLSLSLMVIATFVALGSIFLPRPLDSLLLILIESSLFLPSVFILIAFLSVFQGAKALFVFCLLFFWSPAALLIRAEALKIFSQEYILSARTLGVKRVRLAFFHILPNCLSPLSTSFPLFFSGIFSLLAYIQYLGICSSEPSASLGELLAEGRENLHSTMLVLAPLLATLLPTYLLFSKKKNSVAFKKLQLFYLGYFEWMENLIGQKNRFSRFIKLPKKMPG